MIWVAGGRLKRVAAAARSLHTPVISIGGLAMGGVGKTPMVLLSRGSAAITELQGRRADARISAGDQGEICVWRRARTRRWKRRAMKLSYC